MFKPITALGALSRGDIDANTTFNCPGWLISPTYPSFRCWIYKGYGHGHGALSVVAALEHSCNVWFYRLGERVGLDRQLDWLERLGFGSECGTGLPEERPGIMPHPAETEGVGEARFLAMGQGRVTVTALHVANAVAMLARGGEFRSPLLVRQFADRQVVRQVGATPAAVALVQEGMYKVVNSRTGGTAYNHARDPEIEICGKTGTAETAPRRTDSNGDGRIDQNDEVLRAGDTAWFAGFAPYRAPRVAFVVVAEYAQGSGGPVCGPIARRIAQICREFGYL